MPVFFIRYNPDPYKKPNGKKRCEHESRTKRLNKLKEWLNFAMKNNPYDSDIMVNVIYLYYDGYQDGDGPVPFQYKEKEESEFVIGDNEDDSFPVWFGVIGARWIKMWK